MKLIKFRVSLAALLVLGFCPVDAWAESGNTDRYFPGLATGDFRLQVEYGGFHKSLDIFGFQKNRATKFEKAQNIALRLRGRITDLLSLGVG